MGRAPCCEKGKVKKGPWSPEEDAKLKAYIHHHGTGGNWIALPHKIGLKRCGKSCRLRWLNYLRPNIKHGAFSQQEDNIISTLYLTIGSRWSIIAAQLPGRTDNDIKNYWNTRLKKKLLGKQHLRYNNKEHHHHHNHHQARQHQPHVMINYMNNQQTCPLVTTSSTTTTTPSSSSNCSSSHHHIIPIQQHHYHHHHPPYPYPYPHDHHYHHTHTSHSTNTTSTNNNASSSSFPQVLLLDQPAPTSINTNLFEGFQQMDGSSSSSSLDNNIIMMSNCCYDGITSESMNNMDHMVMSTTSHDHDDEVNNNVTDHNDNTNSSSNTSTESRSWGDMSMSMTSLLYSDPTSLLPQYQAPPIMPQHLNHAFNFPQSSYFHFDAYNTSLHGLV